MSTNQNKYQKSSYFMRLALQQAARSLGNTRQNPAVGCVLVKNNHLISAGYTSIGGRPHAEQNAINFSEINPQNSELYVTLEPCPMCAGALINSRIDMVIFGMYDEKEGCCGSLYQLCRDPRFKHQLAVKGGVMEASCRLIVQEFFKKQRKKN